MMKEKIFIVILGFQGHKRMGKTCAPKMLCFLRHPKLQPTSNVIEPYHQIHLCDHSYMNRAAIQRRGSIIDMDRNFFRLFMAQTQFKLLISPFLH
jgi:hypothetical protein